LLVTKDLARSTVSCLDGPMMVHAPNLVVVVSFVKLVPPLLPRHTTVYLATHNVNAGMIATPTLAQLTAHGVSGVVGLRAVLLVVMV